MFKKIKILLKRIWAVWFLFHFIFFLLLFYPVFYILLSREKWYRYGHKLRVWWGKYILFMSGMYTRVEYEEPLDPTKRYVFAVNHSSYLDIPSVAVGLPFFIQFMAKEELKKIPLFGLFVKTIDVPVNRKNARDSHRAYAKAGEYLKSGSCICLFPEGTIPASAPRLARFKIGAFRLAIEDGIELVPVTLPDNFRRLPDDGSYTATPGKIRVIVHRPIPTADLKQEDADGLKQEVFSIIESKLKEYACYE